MNRSESNIRKDTDEDDENLYGIKKISYWNIYSIKSFQYSGRRKHSACLQQTFSGQFILHNDVFGLTIHQFEHQFRACLERRKQNAERILNLRFPNKTTNEYIEYLECGDATVEDDDKILENVLRPEQNLYEYLIYTVGREKDIRLRQRMFIITDVIRGSLNNDRQHISSGSLAEGLDLQGSDMDQMWVLNNIEVVQNIRRVSQSERHIRLLIEVDARYPGFSKLKLIAKAECRECEILLSNSLVETETGLYVSNKLYIQLIVRGITPPSSAATIHGPCYAPTPDIDSCFSFRMRHWPTNAINWIYRYRVGQWPSGALIDSIVNYGCLLVPIGPKEEENTELFWRISFSVAEKMLSHSMNYTQLLCYSLLKLTLKNFINKDESVKDLLCSYFLKTTVYWVSEENSINVFRTIKLAHCFFLCLDKLTSWVKNCYCPNYFIPEHNMFKGKISHSNNQRLLNVLQMLQHEDFGRLMHKIFITDEIRNVLLPLSIDDRLSVKLDLLFYRIMATPINPTECMAILYRTLKLTELLKNVESTRYISGVCKWYHARLSQKIAQKLRLSNNIHEGYRTLRQCHRHLKDGTESDAVSGWLLYASFYYVLGQYKAALNIVDRVISRCTPDMILIRSNTTNDIEKYERNVGCKQLPLNEKTKLAIIDYVYYIKGSSLIPRELQLEVQVDDFYVPPVVMAHCLRFLCYHHLSDVSNRQQALRDLYLTIEKEYFIVHECISCIILGVCNEIAGYKEKAYRCYCAASQCKLSYVSRAAKVRISNLLTMYKYCSKCGILK